MFSQKVYTYSVTQLWCGITAHSTHYIKSFLKSSTTFCIHGWSSGVGYVALNHRQQCSCCRRSTCLEQYSSRSVLIPDIFYFQNTSEVTSVQHILPFTLTVSRLFFWFRAIKAACAAYTSLNLSLLHYIIGNFGNNYKPTVHSYCKKAQTHHHLSQQLWHDFDLLATSQQRAKCHAGDASHLYVVNDWHQLFKQAQWKVGIFQAVNSQTTACLLITVLCEHMQIWFTLLSSSMLHTGDV